MASSWATYLDYLIFGAFSPSIKALKFNIFFQKLIIIIKVKNLFKNRRNIQMQITKSKAE